jgi:hypothetical protein
MLPDPTHTPVTYADVQDAIRTALDLHAFVNDPLLLSAVDRLTPCLECDNPDNIQLTRASSTAFTFLRNMEDAKITLYGH